jgi:pentatricopeptide repeat protein
MLKRNLTSELVAKFKEFMDKILNYRKDGKNKEALATIDDTFKEIFRLSSKFFNSFSDENLLDMIKTDGTINADKCIMMAKLLEEEALIFEDENNLDEAFYMNLKSLNLFLEAYVNKDNDCDLQDYFSDIQPIIEKVYQYKIPLSMQNKIIDYYVKMERYDKAEDMFYDILEHNDFNKNTLEKGILFYESLLLKDDKALDESNLPREEITESLSFFKSKL